MTTFPLVLALLTAPWSPSCERHEILNQHADAASVRQVDSAWSAAFVHGDTAFMRCLLTADYRGYSLSGAESDRDGEVAKALHYGSPDKPLPAFPKADVEMHGSSAWVGGLSNGRRWIDVYRFEDGAWHAFLSVDVKAPTS
jgi:hypothetical protein